MKIEYVGRGYSVEDAVREYTEDKLAKVLKFLDEPIEAHVALEIEKHHAIAELHVTHRFGSLYSREIAPLMLDAVNAACDNLQTQAERGRKKFRDRRRRAQRAQSTAPVVASELAPEA